MHSPGLKETHWSAHMGPSEGDTHTYTHKTAIKEIVLTFQGQNQEDQTEIDNMV